MNDKKTEPVRVLLSVLTLMMIAIPYGYEGRGFSVLPFIVVFVLVGAGLFGLMKLLAKNGTGSYLRLAILYMSFVPVISVRYLQRFADIKSMFVLREGLTKSNLLGALGMWAPEVIPYLKIMIPSLILLIGARFVTVDVSAGKRRLRRWYYHALIVSSVMLLLLIPFSSFANLVGFIVSIFIVAIMFDLWERIRLVRSLEPEGLVVWSEVLLFAVLWLEGLVEAIAYIVK